MKKMTRLAALALVLVMVLSLCACGAKPEKELMGTWRYAYDFTDAVTGEMPADMVPYLPQEERLVIPVRLTFHEDMTYSATLDQDATVASINAYMEVLIQGLIEMMYVTGEESGINREDMDAVIQEAYGTDIQSLCQEMMAESMDMDALMEEMDVEDAGDWKVKDGRLYMDVPDNGFSKNAYLEYVVNGATLTFVSNEGDVMDLSDLDITYPMVWTKEP